MTHLNFGKSRSTTWGPVHLVDLPEGRRVTISVTGLRNDSGSAWLQPEVELHSAAASQGGNGYFDDDFFDQDAQLTRGKA